MRRQPNPAARDVPSAACLQEGEASISAAAASDVCTSALYSGALQALMLGRPRIALRCFQARPPCALIRLHGSLHMSSPEVHET